MNAAQIDFQQIRIKHILFKSKVRSVLYGGAFDSVFFSDAGPISQWFTGIGMLQYGQEPELPSLLNIHNELLARSLQLFSLYKSGKIDLAHSGMKDIEKLSDTFQGLLAQVESRLAMAPDRV